MRWLLLLLGLELPAGMALIDAGNRSPEQFAGGAEDRRAWLRWLAVAALTSPMLVGYGIVLTYYWNVVKR